MAEAATLGLGGSIQDGRTSNEWHTPPHIFHALGISFDLDPCAPVGGVPWIPAERHYSVKDDGLSQPWSGRVWLNPPYGGETAKWLGRLVEHGDGIACVFVRTDTTWAQAAVKAADAVCLVAGRISFVDGSGRQRRGTNAVASMLLAYGSECSEALAQSNLGTICRTEPEREEEGG